MTVRLKKNRRVLHVLWLACLFFLFCLVPVNSVQTCNMPSASEHPAMSLETVTENSGHCATSKARGGMLQCCNSFCVSSCLPVHVNLALIPLAKPYHAMKFPVIAGVDPAQPLRPPLFS